MALGKVRKVHPLRILDLKEAIDLIIAEDLKTTKDSIDLKIVSKLEAGVVYRLTRLKDQLSTPSKTLTQLRRTIQEKHVTTGEDGKKRMNIAAAEEELKQWMEDENNHEDVAIPVFLVTDFIKDKKFVVPMKFLSLMGDVIEGEVA